MKRCVDVGLGLVRSGVVLFVVFAVVALAGCGGDVPIGVEGRLVFRVGESVTASDTREILKAVKESTSGESEAHAE